MMIRPFKVILILLLFAAIFRQEVSAQRSSNWNYPPELPEAETHVYKKINDIELKAWVFRPKAKTVKSRPAIVFFFGGGWRAGTPGQFYPQCQYLSSRGMVAITVDYRVANRHGVTAGTCLEDAKSALRWVRQNSEKLGIDPNRIVASGGSAGGHLAAAVAMVPGFDSKQDDLSVSSKPNALALFNPALILGPIEGKQQLPKEKIEDIQKRTNNQSVELSPFTHIKRDLPPSIIFHGTNDSAVPFWTVELFQKKMEEAGNRCELKSFPDAPHGFFNMGRGGKLEKRDLESRWSATTLSQLDQFLSSLGYLQGPAKIFANENPNIHFRGHFLNSLAKFRDKKEAHVAFMGGSITQMDGYRPLVCKWLQKRFPDTEFTFTNAGISSTCSTSGAFRLSEHVLKKGKVDLFLVEFAVNDDQDAGHEPRECVRGMEGIIRQMRAHNPFSDIAMIHFVNPGMKNLLDQKKQPVSIANHEKVAAYYNVASIHLAKQVSDDIKSGKLTWQKYGGTHPKLAGNQLCADLVADLLEKAWPDSQENIASRPHTLPRELLNHGSYVRGRFLNKDLDKGNIKVAGDWKLSVPLWKTLKGSFRSQFNGLTCFHNSTPDEELTISFSGTAIGAYVLAGPDAGRLEVSIDGQPFKQVELYHRHSRGLHYPRTVIFEADLEDKEHIARIRISKTNHAASKGTAARIMEFVVN